MANTERTLAFASHAMPMQTLGRRASLKSPDALRELLSPWKEWPDTLVFDQWIANPDRHAGNLLIGAPGEVYLIDHGLSFYRRNWTPEQLEAAISIVTARLWTEILQSVITLPERISAAGRTQDSAIRFAKIDLDDAMNSTKISQFIPPAHLQALVKFLGARCVSAAAVICSVMGIPDLPLGSRP